MTGVSTAEGDATASDAPVTLDRRGIGIGVAALLVVVIVYAAITDTANSPLSMFVLPALFVAVISGPAEVSVIGLFSVVSTAVAGAVDDGVNGPVLWTRIVIVLVAAAAAALLAWHRGRREQQLEESVSARQVVDALQTRLVTVPLPPEGIGTGVRYVPGDERLAVGGDFLDAVTLPDGALGFIIGDVSGHGASAAAFGVVVRAGWKAIAIEHPDDPCYWLDALQRSFFEDGRFDGFATALVGRVMPGDPRIEMCSAGHCWPIVVDEDTRLLDTCNSAPLGVPTRSGRQVVELDLASDGVLLLYTDGLIENRKAPPAEGRWSEGELLEYVRRNPGFSLDDLLLTFGGPDGFDDDVALMTISPHAEAPASARPRVSVRTSPAR